MNHKFISKGMIAAGLSNILGVLIFSKFFRNTYLNEADPVVMSNFGLLMIIVWGLAYISVARHYKKVPLLIFVFALEKLIYSGVWFYWQLSNDLSLLYEKDLYAGIFYSVYGINDIFFMIFFIFVFIHSSKNQNN